MPAWIKAEYYRNVEMRDGCVFKTKKERSEWFEVGKVPEPTPEGRWQVTLEYHYGPTKPAVTVVRC